MRFKKTCACCGHEFMPHSSQRERYCLPCCAIIRRRTAAEYAQRREARYREMSLPEQSEQEQNAQDCECSTLETAEYARSRFSTDEK